MKSLQISLYFSRLSAAYWLLQGLVCQCFMQNMVPTYATGWCFHSPKPHGLPTRTCLHTRPDPSTRTDKQGGYTQNLGRPDPFSQTSGLRAVCRQVWESVSKSYSCKYCNWFSFILLYLFNFKVLWFQFLNGENQYFFVRTGDHVLSCMRLIGSGFSCYIF